MMYWRYFLGFLGIFVLTLLSCVLLAALSMFGVFRPSLVMTPSELPEAQVGVEYHTELSISRNDTPLSSIIVYRGELPPGLKLTHKIRQQTATISGVPQVAGSYDMLLRVSCLGTMVNGQRADRYYTITVK